MSQHDSTNNRQQIQTGNPIQHNSNRSVIVRYNRIEIEGRRERLQDQSRSNTWPQDTARLQLTSNPTMDGGDHNLQQGKDFHPDNGFKTPLSHRLGSHMTHFNLLGPEEGVDLPETHKMNYQGFLIQKLISIRDTDKKAVQGQATWLKDHIVIASFICKKIAQHHLANWIQSISSKIGLNSISF
jgi:hypothetical protein